MSTSTLRHDCRTGNLARLKKQSSAGAFSDDASENNQAVQLASRFGHLDVLKWLVEESKLTIDFTAVSNWPVQLAAENGHLDVVKWLVKESGQAVDITDHDNLALQLAAENGHLDVVKWLVEESGQAVDVTAVSNRAVRWAAGSGHLGVVRWLVEESGQTVDCRDCETWELVEDFNNLTEDIRAYLLFVKQLQEMLGLDDWKTGLELRKTASRQRLPLTGRI